MTVNLGVVFDLNITFKNHISHVTENMDGLIQ